MGDVERQVADPRQQTGVRGAGRSWPTHSRAYGVALLRLKSSWLRASAANCRSMFTRPLAGRHLWAGLLDRAAQAEKLSAVGSKQPAAYVVVALLANPAEAAMPDSQAW